jgi:hypothetical protein
MGAGHGADLIKRSGEKLFDHIRRFVIGVPEYQITEIQRTGGVKYRFPPAYTGGVLFLTAVGIIFN